MTDQDPTKPIPNDEKFKPQNVSDAGKSGKARDAERPADTGRRDLPRGSEPETRNSSNLRR